MNVGELLQALEGLDPRTPVYVTVEYARGITFTAPADFAKADIVDATEDAYGAEVELAGFVIGGPA